MKHTLHFRHSLALAAMAFFMLLPGLGWGQTVVSYTGMGAIVCPAAPNATIAPAVSGLTFSQISRGSGVTCSSLTTGITGSGFNVPLATAISGNKWYTYSITSDASTSFTVSSLSIITQVSSATGSPSISVQYSIGAGAKIPISSFAPTTSSATYPVTPSSPISVGSGQTINIFLIPNTLTAIGTTCRITNGSSVTVTATAAIAPNWTSGWPKAEIPTPSGFTAKANINVTGTAYFVVLPNGAAAPSSAQVKAGQDASSAPLASNLKGTIACAAGSTEYTAAVTGLSSSTTYNVYFVAEASALLQASPTMVSVTTTSSASAPSVSSPTATTITNNSALLGGDVTSDGGSAITEIGTVWKASAGVSITDNPATSTGTTGVFTHSRTGFTAKSQFFYRAYAKNIIGTTLSSEASFFTLADEPTAHVGSFAAIASSTVAINLSWTPAAGADGYLILKKQGISAPTGTPSDATGYSTGNTIGDGIVAADVLSGATTSQSITGLTASTQYYFTIIPYAYDALNYQTYNYNTTATIPSATATTQDPPATTVLWDGGASTSAWADANNWDANVVPGASDLVILDNSLVPGSYVVVLPSGAVKTTLRRLTISPITGNTITLTLPVANTYGASGDAGLVVGDNVAATDDIIINEGGVLINASGGSSGNGVQVNALANGTCRINNGGKYVHATSRSAAGIAPLLSIAPGTETGIYEYDAPGTSNFGIQASGRNYGSLTLTRTAGTAVYSSSGGSALTIKGNFTINSGVTYTSTMTGAMNVSGNFTNNGTALTIPLGQAVNLNGSSIQNLYGPSSITLSGAVAITNAAGVVINSNAGVTVGGTLTNSIGNSGLIIKSGGSLKESSGVAATVERDITGSEWHLISSPVAGATAEMFLGKYMQTFAEPNTLHTYDDVTIPATALIPVKGFALWGDLSGFTAPFTGPLNTGIQSNNTLTRSGTGVDWGWNLIGNPYPSYIDWLSSGMLKENVNNATYFHVDKYTWAAYNGGVGTISATQYIAPGQGFFVQVTDGFSTGSLSMDNTVRVHNAAPFYKNSVNNLVRLKLSGSDNIDEAIVRFLTDASATFDGNYDAYKLFGDDANAAQIYTVSGDKLAINALPQTDAVQVGVRVGASGTYTIAATEINEMPAVSLEDTQTGIFTDLTKSSYTFNGTTGDSELRFALHFGTLSVNETENAVSGIYANHGILYVDLKDNAKSEILVYTVTGQIVAKVPATQGSNKISLVNTGNYIVKVISDRSTMVKKVFIK